MCKYDSTVSNMSPHLVEGTKASNAYISQGNGRMLHNFANLISKLNFYKLIPYPMDNCFTGRRDRSRQTPEKDVLYIIPAGPVSSVHSLGGASYLLPVQTE